MSESPKGMLNEVVEYNPSAGRIEVPKYLRDKFRAEGFDLGWVGIKNIGRKKLEGWVQVSVKDSDGIYNTGVTEFAQYEDLYLCKRKIQISEQKKLRIEKLNDRQTQSVTEAQEFETTAKAGNAQTSRRIDVKREVKKQ